MPEDSEKRLNEIKRLIIDVSSTLSRQQKVIEKFQGVNSQNNNEIATLKESLTRLQTEYNIIVNENYTLRVQIQAMHNAGIPETNSPQTRSGKGNSGKKLVEEEYRSFDLSAIQKTSKRQSENRRASSPDLMDTSEIDLSRFR